MIDSFELLRDQIEAADTRDTLGVTAGDYALVTLHRPSNVDSVDTLAPIVQALINASESIDVVFVAHPRTIKGLDAFGLTERLAAAARVTLLEPLSYIRFMNVAVGARVVITDSGGLQEETTYLGVPCLTLRENTERPITVTMGTNQLISAPELGPALASVLAGDIKQGKRPPLWDGRTAQRAVEALRNRV